MLRIFLSSSLTGISALLKPSGSLNMGRVASIPTLHPSSFSWSAAGSRLDTLTLGTSNRSSSPLNRVAMAHSTCCMSKGSMSLSTTTACLRLGWAANIAIKTFLGSPSLNFSKLTTQWSHPMPPTVRLTPLTLGTTPLTYSHIIGS